MKLEVTSAYIFLACFKFHIMSSEQNRAFHIKVSSSSEIIGICRDIRSIPDTISYLINLAIYSEFYKSH